MYLCKSRFYYHSSYHKMDFITGLNSQYEWYWNWIHFVQQCSCSAELKTTPSSLTIGTGYYCICLSVLVCYCTMCTINASLEVNPPTREFHVSLCFYKTYNFSVALMIYNCAIGTLISRGHSNNITIGTITT